MKDYTFSPNAYNVLTKAGWYKGRSINPAKYETMYLETGFPILSKVLSFLQEFGDLKCRFHNKINGILDDFDFDVARALDIEGLGRVTEDYMPRINGRRLCLIGTAYREHFVLLMDEEGVVYGGYSDYFVKMAETGEMAIEAMLAGYDFVEID